MARWGSAYHSCQLVELLSSIFFSLFKFCARKGYFVCCGVDSSGPDVQDPVRLCLGGVFHFFWQPIATRPMISMKSFFFNGHIATLASCTEEFDGKPDREKRHRSNRHDAITLEATGEAAGWGAPALSDFQTTDVRSPRLLWLRFWKSFHKCAESDRGTVRKIVDLQINWTRENVGVPCDLLLTSLWNVDSLSIVYRHVHLRHWHQSPHRVIESSRFENRTLLMWVNSAKDPLSPGYRTTRVPIPAVLRAEPTKAANGAGRPAFASTGEAVCILPTFGQRGQLWHRGAKHWLSPQIATFWTAMECSVVVSLALEALFPLELSLALAICCQNWRVMRDASKMVFHISNRRERFATTPAMLWVARDETKSRVHQHSNMCDDIMESSNIQWCRPCAETQKCVKVDAARTSWIDLIAEHPHICGKQLR